MKETDQRHKKKDVVRVAIYIRVSTYEQVSGGYGLEYQEDDLSGEVKYRSKKDNWVHKPEWMYVDAGESGSSSERPEYKRMMEDAKKGMFDMIAVWKIDRLSRSLSELLRIFEQLKEYGVGFFSYKENFDVTGAIGRLTFQIFGALAEFERETIKMRTIEGKKAAARRGYYIGNGVPYGYKPKKHIDEKGSKLVVVSQRKKTVQQIFSWFVYEQMNYEQIARHLNKLGVHNADSQGN